MFNSGAMEHIDGFSVHPYASTPLSTIKQYNKLQKIFRDFNFDKPVWVTEVGYFTGPRPFFSTKRNPEYVVKTLSGLSARADGIRNMIWYELMNNYNPEEKKTLNPLKHMGLIYPNKTFKPGAEAFMLSAGYLAGTEYRPELPLREGRIKNITHLYFLREDGTSVLILWKDGPGKQSLRLDVPNAENLLSHNIHNREASLLPDGRLPALGRTPVFITWKGGGVPRLIGLDK